jgi:DNA repair exonuclease SbcCD ATPase subunit
MGTKHWTFKTLLEFVMQRINDLEDKLDERYQTQTKATDATRLSQETAMRTAFEAADKAVQAALAAAEKAAAKAEAAAKDRFEAVNEFRGQLADQAATLISRVEHSAQLQALSDKIDALTQRLNDMDKRLSSRLDLGQGSDQQLSRVVDLKHRSAALTAQWVAIIFVASGVLASIIIGLVH